MKQFCLLALLLSSITAAIAAEKYYDFRASQAYKSLSAKDRRLLDQVRRDQTLLWGALDMYADDHYDNPPDSLDQLVPRYLAELPSDPFASKESKPNARYIPSKNGAGYQYRRGAPGNRAWIILSVGLPDFPYLAERGNVGLYLAKGTWISGLNPAIKKQ